MPKLTKAMVESLQASTKPSFLWDDALAGFGVKVLRSGSKKYVVKCRVSGTDRDAAQRWILLGAHGVITLDQARDMARQTLASVARGEDPKAEKQRLQGAPKVSDLWGRFEREYLSRRKPATRREYNGQWRDLISPRFGKSLVAEVGRSQVDAFHKSLADTPYRANRTLALLARLFSLAEDWGWIPPGTNPCKRLEKFREVPRSRYLNHAEIARVGSALSKLSASGEIQLSSNSALCLLLLTGARLNELLTARLEWIDWDRRILALPDSKTGAKPIYLSEAAIAILRRQADNAATLQSEFIFPGRLAGSHLVNLRKSWVRVCAEAGLSGVRLHDLRHTAASVAIGQGASLPIVGRLLGHSQAQTTLRYAHVSADPALAAADAVGSAISLALGAN